MRRDLGNFGALFGIQAANAALPLLVFPHLLYVAGPQRYAQVAMAETVALAVLMLSSYSFDVDALARVVGRDPRRDADEVARAFSGVLATRLALFVVSSGCALVAVSAIAPELRTALALWLLLPLAQILQSAWLFQGLERSAPLACCVIAARAAGVALVLALVRDADDFLLVPLLVGITACAGAAAALVWAGLRMGLRWRSVSLAEISRLVREGRAIFVGGAAVFLYRDLNVLLLGAVGAGAAAVSSYSIAEKLVKGIQAAARPLTQLFFPKALRALRNHVRADTDSLRALLKLTLPQLVLLGLMVAGLAGAAALAADRLPARFILPDSPLIWTLLAWMLPAVFFGVGNFMLGSVGLNHLGQRRWLALCLLGVGSLNVALCLALAALAGARGAAAAFVVAEALLFALVLARYRGNANSPERA